MKRQELLCCSNKVKEQNINQACNEFLEDKVKVKLKEKGSGGEKNVKFPIRWTWLPCSLPP